MADYLIHSCPVPNLYLDRLLALLTADEFKVLAYVCRRTFGFGKATDRLSVRQIAEGLVSASGERLDHGTGQSVDTVRECLHSLKRFGVMLLVAENDPRRNEGPEYKPQIDPERIDWAGLEQRRQALEAKNQTRIQKARASRKQSPPLAAQDHPPLVTQDHPCGTRVPLSHKGTPPLVAQEAPPLVAQETQKPVENQRKPESTPPSEGVAAAPPPLRASRKSKSAGSVPAPNPSRLPSEAEPDPKRYRTAQALNIAVRRVEEAYLARCRLTQPQARMPVLQPQDRQAVRDALKGIAQTDGCDYLAAEREVIGYAERLADQARPLHKLKYELNDLRNGEFDGPKRDTHGGQNGPAPAGRRTHASHAADRQQRAAAGVAEFDRIWNQARGVA